MAGANGLQESRGDIDSPAVGVITERAAARYIGIGLSTLRKRRRNGDGPRHVTIGNRHLYRTSDCDDWLESKLSK